MVEVRDIAEPECIIVTGMPGAGKSTVTEIIAKSLPRAARLSGDEVSAMVRSGRVWALGSPRDEAERQIELMLRNVAALANNMTAAHFTTVLDVVLESRAELATLTDALTCTWDLVVLAPGAEVCRDRNATRNIGDRWDFTGYDRLDVKMRESFSDNSHWIDTSNLTAEESAAYVLRRVRAAS
ncbi:MULTISPECIES: AAA family ATPase [unclassified Microbacterium]|uniref:AAA family ATPase n=1 Tax=unclassified Microbacterium TaxID=2609290 RepID=UPI0034662755